MLKRVLITGGFGALGMATARAFASAGDRVALIDRAEPPSASYDAVLVAGADLSDQHAAKEAFARAKAGLGGADVLVNVAGTFRFEPIAAAGEAWPLLFEVNVVTAVNMCRAAAEGLSDGGAIVNVGAAAAERAAGGMAPYSASKAAVARLTESLAAELGGRIRVNAVAPLTMDTPQNRKEMPGVDPAKWTSTGAIADVIVFLASDAARAINGAIVAATNAGV